jgi:hypothetical protein
MTSAMREMGGIQEVQTRESLGPAEVPRQLGDRQPRGVGCEHGSRRGQRLDLCENLPFHRGVLDDGLDREVGGVERSLVEKTCFDIFRAELACSADDLAGVLGRTPTMTTLAPAASHATAMPGAMRPVPTTTIFISVESLTRSDIEPQTTGATWTSS